MWTRTERLLAILGVVGLLAWAPDGAVAQTSDSPASSGASAMEIVEIQPEAQGGVWPTSRMLDSMLRRLAAEVGEKYDLRPEQRRAVEDRMVQRWGGFFNRNRQEIEPLLTDYLESRLSLEPPSADHVADWAAQAMPVFRRLRHNAEAGEQEIRELLDADQRAQFDQGSQEREMGLEIFEGQLKRWSVGKFRQDEWWDPPADREGDGANSSPLPPEFLGDAARRATAATTNGEPPARIALELHAWEKYVADFCDRFDLDQSQRNAADSILREMIERAEDHVKTYRVRIAVLEERIATGTGDGAAFERELQELYGPIDAMFRELVERVEKLPTDGQRHRAGMDDTGGEATDIEQ